MKKSLLPFLTMLCLLKGQAQVLFLEDFESDFETNGWLTTPVWQIGTAADLSSQSFTIPSHTKIAGVNDDAAGEGVSSFGRIATHEIDLTGIPAALLQFDCYFINGDYDADETARLLISTDGMASWQLLRDIQGGTNWQSIAVYLDAGQPIHLAFEYDDDDGWNYGLGLDNVKVQVAPEYFANIELASKLDYTVSTPRQTTEPLRFVHKVENYGTQPLSDIKFELKATIIGQGTIALDSHLLVTVPPGGMVMDTFLFFPTAHKRYSFSLKASHAQFGTGFYQKTLVNAFELSDSTLARDDGERDASIGFSFGNPTWYGYYGSEFDLNAPDTLTGISVWMTTNTVGSFNLLVNQKDSTGLPNIELYHAAPKEIQANFSGWVYSPLPTPMPLNAGNYIFAVGQDTIQGIMGHGFDTDRINPGYWIISPVAGGGYPWTNNPNLQTLMIRPHFKAQPFVSRVKEEAMTSLSVYPNPTTGYLYLDEGGAVTTSRRITIMDANGRMAFSQNTASNELNVKHLQPGLYFLKMQDGDKVGVAKFMKL